MFVITQIADRWKRCCEGDKEGKLIEQEYWEQEPPLHRSEVAIHQTGNSKATVPEEVPAELFKAGDRLRQYCTQCTKYVWRSWKLLSDKMNGRTPHSPHFPRKVILNNVQITEQLLLSPVACK